MVEAAIKVKSLGFNQILFLRVRLIGNVKKWEDRKWWEDGKVRG